eukprot:symbB.v1.2.015756.t1/scaffold1187.1/size155418/5
MSLPSRHSTLDLAASGEEWALPSISSLDGRPFGQHSNLVSSGGGCNHSIRSHSGGSSVFATRYVAPISCLHRFQRHLCTTLWHFARILNMIFNGTLLAHADKVPWIMRWLFKVVPSKYTFRSGIKLEFDGLVFEGFAECSDPSLPAAVRAVMPCWGEAGLDVVAALAGQMFPVLAGDFTYVGDLLFILGALVVLKFIHALLMLRAYHGCCNCRRLRAFAPRRRRSGEDMMSPVDTRRHRSI